MIYRLAPLISATTLTLILAASGCGKGNPAPAPLTPPQVRFQQQLPAAGAPGTPGAANTVTPTAPAALEGTWNTACLPDGLASGNAYYTEQYTFTANRNFTHTRTAYSDSGCGTKTDTSTITGSFSPGATVQARYARADQTNKRFQGTRGDSVAMELVIDTPIDSAGKKYTVERIEGQSLYMGVLPYDDQPEDRGGDHVPSLDVSKEFKK